MEYRILKEENFNISNWTGGKTKQLAIFPEDGNYLERRFIWRLSSATCELEESDFSKLPDFNRVLLVLKGSVVLAHQDVRVAKLAELEQDSFDGAYKTKSFGKITDYNLMVAKGNEGFADIITPTNESFSPEILSMPQYELATQAYYCRDGFAIITINGKTVMLQEGQQLVINYKRNENLNVSIMGEGHFVRCQIFYNYQPEEMRPEVIPKEKATFDDFKTCVYIANTQFRGASFFFRKLKTTWYDEELTEGIRKIEKLYLTFLVWILGFAVTAFIGMDYLQGLEWIGLIMLWTAADCLIVSPLMFFAVLPKPIKKHIKDINHLTPYEEKVLAKQRASNERLDRILKRYKHTGRAAYDENGNRIDEIKPFDFFNKE